MDNFWYRFRFFSIGLALGLMFIIIFFGERLSCSQYLPNGRVLAEVKSKPILATKEFKDFAIKNNIDSTFVMDSLLKNGKINFDESQPRKLPCAEYVLYYDSNKKYKLLFTKCKKNVTLTKLSIEK